MAWWTKSAESRGSDSCPVLIWLVPSILHSGCKPASRRVNRKSIEYTKAMACDASNCRTQQERSALTRDKIPAREGNHVPGCSRVVYDGFFSCSS